MCPSNASQFEKLNRSFTDPKFNISHAASLIYIGHPFGSFSSGFLSDALGRRKSLMLIMVPAVATFITLGMAESFWVVCVAVFIISLIFGLKDAPATCYVSEIRYN